MKVTEGDAINVWERVDCNWRYNSWASARGAGHRMNEQAPPREECKVNLDINDGTAEYWHDYRAQLSKNPRLSSPLQHAGRDDVWVSHQQVFQVEGAAQKDRAS